MAYVADLFVQARNATTVGLVAGVKLYREGKSWRGECPLCHASQGSIRGGAFWTNHAQSKWMCFNGCADKPSDVIELEHRLRAGPGESHRDAALRILGQEGMSVEERQRREAALAQRGHEDAAAEVRRMQFRASLARSLWREGQPAAGTLVEAYLRACGFDASFLEASLKMLRFHPAAFHSGDPSAPVAAPAMIGLLMTPFGPTGGVHVTYLQGDGLTKTELYPPGKKWGPSYVVDDKGAHVPGGVWLTPPTAAGPVIVGEGCETVLAAGMLYREPCRLVAALDLAGVQGRLLVDDDGRVDISTPRSNPERPAFTWPGVDDVIVCLDHDMKPIALALSGDGPTKTPLDATARALLCASMASAAWRNAGTRQIRLAYPPQGMDVRDQFIQQIGGELDLRLPSRLG